MSDADEQARLIERKRREREDELLLLLLALSDDARRQTAFALQHGFPVRTVLVNTLASVVPAAANTMAVAHADAVRRFGRMTGQSVPRLTPEELAAIARQYVPQAQAMRDAMIETLNGAVIEIQAKFPDESPKILANSAFDNVGYTKDAPHGLDQGAERSIVLASNVGMIQGAQQVANAEGRGGAELPPYKTKQVIGLRHWSVVDSATTDICLDRHQLTLPATHPYFLHNCPPLHSRCRSVILPVLGAYEADTVLPSIPPAYGWGAMPQGFLTQFGLAA